MDMPDSFVDGAAYDEYLLIVGTEEEDIFYAGLSGEEADSLVYRLIEDYLRRYPLEEEV